MNRATTVALVMALLAGTTVIAVLLDQRAVVANSVLGGASRGEGVCGAPVLDPSSPSRWLAVAGVSELEVRVEGARLPMAGTMTSGPEQKRVFRPALSFTPGMRYKFSGKTPSGAACEGEFELPKAEAKAPEVVAIYPRASELPENILRFYVYFSEPMADGDFLEHVRVRNTDTGEVLSGVFFDNIHELWSRDRRRITLLVDPGRVKTGLQANQKMGRAFVAGNTYELHVLPSWTSAADKPLVSTHVKTFRTIPEERARVAFESWRLELPTAQSREPLSVDFGRPVDHVSVHHMLSVFTPDGAPMRGRWTLDPGDQVARWMPEIPWEEPVEAYSLRARSRFEDTAGNNLGAAFDHPIGAVPREGEDRVVTRRLEN